MAHSDIHIRSVVPDVAEALTERIMRSKAHRGRQAFLDA